jgi:hypothetical protein
VTAREVMDGIKARIERLDYVRENGSSDWLHASANTDLKALTAAVERVLALCDGADKYGDYHVIQSDTIRAALENALEGE